MEIEVSRRQFFALFARGAHGAKNPKSVATLAGRLPACDPARPRSAGAGFESKGRRRAAWNRAWAPGPSGHGMRARRRLQGRSRELAASRRGRLRALAS